MSWFGELLLHYYRVLIPAGSKILITADFATGSDVPFAAVPHCRRGRKLLGGPPRQLPVLAMAALATGGRDAGAKLEPKNRLSPARRGAMQKLQ